MSEQIQTGQILSGLGCQCFLVLILLCCKFFIPFCAGWSLIWIFCPLWIPLIIGFIIGIIASICVIFKQTMKQMEEKINK